MGLKNIAWSYREVRYRDEDNIALTILFVAYRQSRAMALKKLGAEVVYFDISEPGTHEAALEGCHGIYVVTNYWEHGSIQTEKEQVQSIAASIEKAGIQHVVWSTLEGTTAFFNSLDESRRPNKIDGDSYVPHFDGKHESDQYFPTDKTTKLFTSLYLENLSGTGMVHDGILVNNMGDSPLPVIACDDIGKCAYGIFQAGTKYVGKNVYIAGDVQSCTSLMNIASDVTQRQFEYKYVDRETYASMDFPGSNELANMFDFIVQSETFVKKRNPRIARELNPSLLSAREWMEQNVDLLLTMAANKPKAESNEPAKATTRIASVARTAESKKPPRVPSKTKVAPTPSTATTPVRKNTKKSVISHAPVNDEEEVWA